MKISDTSGTGISGIGGAQGGTPSVHAHGARGGHSRRNDQIQLSSLSQTLAALQTNSPERDARLGQLSSDVGGGRYQVDNFAVSGSVIRETLAASSA